MQASSLMEVQERRRGLTRLLLSMGIALARLLRPGDCAGSSRMAARHGAYLKYSQLRRRECGAASRGH